VAYAEGTSVSVAKSRMELDQLLQKSGAAQRGFADDDSRGLAVIWFTLKERQYRLEVPLPKMTDDAVKYVWRRGSKYLRGADQARAAHEQLCRTRWRAIVLLIKAKLEAIEIGLSTPEREFLADLLLPDGRRLHQALTPQIAETYATGAPPPLLGTGDPT
jgi:hypothetical protein